MKKIKLFIPILFVIIILLGSVSACTHTPPPKVIAIPTVGEQLPELTLKTPADKLIRNYLGLKNDSSETFTAGEIQCDILLIQIFSMYCPFCQREAPNVNQFFNLVQTDRKLAKKIKMIGIGAGNSAFEVGVFKKKYSVEFPLFADSDFTLHNKLGQVRTPYFFAICNRGEKKNQILISKLGGLADPKIFLRSLTDLLDATIKGEK